LLGLGVLFAGMCQLLSWFVLCEKKGTCVSTLNAAWLVGQLTLKRVRAWDRASMARPEFHFPEVLQDLREMELSAARK
jgi:hypothetical protein